MKVTAQTKTTIINGMTAKGLNASSLSEKLGKHRSYVTKLLSPGGISELSDEMVDQLSDILGVPIHPIPTSAGKVSPIAAQLSALAEQNPALAQMMEALLQLAQPAEEAYLPVIETKKLPKVGAAISQIVHRWEQPGGDYTPKIAVEVLDWLRKYYGKGMP